MICIDPCSVTHSRILYAHPCVSVVLVLCAPAAWTAGYDLLWRNVPEKDVLSRMEPVTQDFFTWLMSHQVSRDIFGNPPTDVSVCERGGFPVWWLARPHMERR